MSSKLKILLYELRNELKLKKLGLRITKGKFYEFKGIKLLRSCNHCDILSDLFFKNHYDYVFSPCEKYTVIDVGMNSGIVALYLALNPQVEKIYAFEPFKPVYQKALEHFKLNPVYAEKIIAHNFGLGDKDKTIQANFDGFMHSCMSTVEEVYAKNITRKTETAVVKKASPIISEILKTENRIFLKMDCEGAENEIMRDLDKEGLLRKIDVMILEWHFNSSQELIEILRKNDFEIFAADTHDGTGIIRALRQ